MTSRWRRRVWFRGDEPQIPIYSADPPRAADDFRRTVRARSAQQASRIGARFAAETEFKLFSDPDTVRAPDTAFVRGDRLPGPIPAKYLLLAPDLAVEVLSPNDRRDRVDAKIADWIHAGSSLVWVIDPVRRTARVVRPDGTESRLAAGDVLSGESVLCGFSCPLADVLQD